MGKRRAKVATTVGDVCAVMERAAPLGLAQDWDNVGLLAGDRNAAVERVLMCIDMTGAVVDEAIRKRVQFVMAYHPVLFKAVSRLTWPSDETDGLVFRCVANGIAVYSMHTALDAAEGGTNDVLADMCGVGETEPFEYVGGESGKVKVVVFVPEGEADAVAGAMFEAGAGWIGDYERCSFRIPGTGTFLGGEETEPAIGLAGRYETVKEVRVEMVVKRRDLPAVVEALRTAHSYEEPAFDVYPLVGEPVRGIGRVGTLTKATTLKGLVRKLKRATGAVNVQTVGDVDGAAKRVVVCVGAAGSWLFALGIGAGDVVVTGEIRHHDALAIARRGASAIALGHWASERPVLAPLAELLGGMMDGVRVDVSEADCDPFGAV